MTQSDHCYILFNINNHWNVFPFYAFFFSFLKDILKLSYFFVFASQNLVFLKTHILIDMFKMKKDFLI